MSRLLRLAAVLIPALGLAGLWGMSDHTYRQGTEWEVPIMGYDPRDILRGHYVEFTYDWPREGAAEGRLAYLCLFGDPPRLDRAVPAESEADLADCAHPAKADPNHIYGMSSLERGRLYLDQNRARVLDKQLRNRDQRGIVTIRQREDGSFTPIAIHFRPHTPEERAGRDMPEQRPFTPPPIMDTPSGNPRP
ncbi:GDYXXLXY domain-containing protein [Erythrobacter sanguineus]|jgi:hypothetical protein|uniref:GDYXXLXY protein n=1 Tax=Erythrobacter sanguineus TaxID=198312 RepID=A0A1M7SKI2_9SPHN|nr:GDYXXLXY domain-containing protein [Erythrobacter sanguineus]SHN58964.1 GDYXXLXY protein [Erythrobacter sanguineus]